MKRPRLHGVFPARFLPAIAVLLLPPVFLPAAAGAGSGWEITPFAGLHFAGSFEDNTTGAGLDAKDGGAFGLLLGIPDEADTRYELFYGFQRTKLEGGGALGGEPLFDLDVHYLHLGGSYRATEGRARPFAAGGLGATHFAPRGSGPGGKTYFSLSLGGGALFPVSGRVSFRLEGRGFLTVLPADAELFCVSSGGAVCRVDVRGDVFGQFLLLGGVVFSP